MGHLDEETFATKLKPCAGCGGTRFELLSMIDLWQPVMLGEAAGQARWAHDGEKFVDGTYRITCASCARVLFEDADCPRCHAKAGLATALANTSRLVVPKRCPKCNELELMAIAVVPE